MKFKNLLQAFLISTSLIPAQVALAQGETAASLPITAIASGIIEGASYFIFEGEDEEKRVDYLSEHAIFYSAQGEELARVKHSFDRVAMAALLDPQAQPPLVKRYEIRYWPACKIGWPLCPGCGMYLYLFDKNDNLLAKIPYNHTTTLEALHNDILENFHFDMSHAAETIWDDPFEA